MKYVALLALCLTAFGFPGISANADPAICECPKLSCNSACEIEEAVTFYSEKCSDGVKVRSCARPTCVKKDPLPAMCKSAAQNVAPEESSPQDRMPASAPTAENKIKVGIVEALVGDAWILQVGTTDIKLSVGDLVNEKDKVKTGPKSRLQIRFDDGNEVILAENSELRLSEVTISTDASKRNVLLQLLKGKVRGNVKQKYKGAESQFKVSTKSAVAGVRGTEFVVELKENKDADERRTVVSTFTGKVELRGHDRPDAATIARGEMAQFVEKGVSKEDEPGYIARAYLSQIVRLTDKQIRELRDVTSMDTRGATKRDVASENLVQTCKKPDAEFNQCRWQCRNNPAGEKTCRTDLPNVDCVRSVCKADGNWRDDTRLPASFGHFCEPSKVVVGTCDY